MTRAGALAPGSRRRASCTGERAVSFRTQAAFANGEQAAIACLHLQTRPFAGRMRFGNRPCVVCSSLGAAATHRVWDLAWSLGLLARGALHPPVALLQDVTLEGTRTALLLAAVGPLTLALAVDREAVPPTEQQRQLAQRALALLSAVTAAHGEGMATAASSSPYIEQLCDAVAGAQQGRQQYSQAPRQSQCHQQSPAAALAWTQQLPWHKAARAEPQLPRSVSGVLAAARWEAGSGCTQWLPALQAAAADQDNASQLLAWAATQHVPRLMRASAANTCSCTSQRAAPPARTCRSCAPRLAAAATPTATLAALRRSAAASALAATAARGADPEPWIAGELRRLPAGSWVDTAGWLVATVSAGGTGAASGYFLHGSKESCQPEGSAGCNGAECSNTRQPAALWVSLRARPAAQHGSCMCGCNTAAASGEPAGCACWVEAQAVCHDKGWRPDKDPWPA